MDAVLARVRRALRQKFPRPAGIKLNKEHGVYGVVVSSQFEGLESRERIDMIMDHLDEALTPQERKKVTVIFAMTPEEQALHAELNSHS